MHGRLARAVVWAVLAALLALLSASSSQAATLPAGFAEETVVTGLTQPTAVRFSSDDRVFVAEKSGLDQGVRQLVGHDAACLCRLAPEGA